MIKKFTRIVVFALFSALTCLDYAAATHVAHHQPAKQMWNLQGADIKAVIQTISELTGKNFIIDPRVNGKVTVMSSKPMGVDESYKMFLSMLQVLNYSAIPSKDAVKIVPSSSAKSYGGELVGHKSSGDEVEVRLLDINNVSAMQLVPVIRPLMQEWGSVNAYTPSNTLILAGMASNISHIVKMVRRMDSDSMSNIEMVTLKHASAKRLVTVINSLMAADKSQGKATNVSISADEENNTILVSGNRYNRVKIKKLIERLDAKQAHGNLNTEVIHLNYLKATELAPLLTKIAHGQMTLKAGKEGAGTVVGNKSVSIQPEKTTNTLIINAPFSLIQTLKKVIVELDGVPDQVLVEAVIVRVDETLVNKLGIIWGTVKNSLGTSTGVVPGTSGINTGGTSDSFTQGMGFIPGGSIKALLTALSTSTATDILSTPSIVVLNNGEASISNGQSLGVENRQYAGTATGDSSTQPFTTLQRQNVALTLKVTPQISPNNTVQLKIDQKDDSLANPSNPGTNPTVNTSSIKTNVLVNSGDILVLGGLLKHDHLGGASKVPVLGDIPLLGKLFTYNDRSFDKKNLMVFIRPIILHTRKDNAKATKKRYRYMRNEQMRWRSGQHLISSRESAPVLPRVDSPKLAQLPDPF